MSANQQELKTAEEFKAHFAGIPDDQWCVGNFENQNGQRCALGHCGVRQFGYRDGETPRNLYALLTKYFPKTEINTVVAINDGRGGCPAEIAALETPKARILAALDSIIAKEKAAQ